MKRINLVPLAAIAAMMATTGLSAHAQGLPGPAGQGFGVFLFGNLNAYASGGGGRIGVGGNADVEEFTAGTNLPNSFYPSNQQLAHVTYGSRADIIVGGNFNDQQITNPYGSAPNGDVRYGGLLTTGNASQTPVLPTAAPPNFIPGSTINFAQAQTGYTSLSSVLSSQATSAGTTLDFTPGANNNSSTSQGYFVVNVDPSVQNQTVFENINVADYNSYAYFGPGTFHYIGVNAPSSDTVVINLHGSATDIYGNTGQIGFYYSDNVDKNAPTGGGTTTTDLSKVLINAPDATTIDGFGSTVMGTYLAPQANVHFSNNQVGSGNGVQFIANSLYSVGNGINFNPANAFSGDLSAYSAGINFGTILPENPPLAVAPEPGSWASMGLGSLNLLGLALRARRGRRSA